MFVRTSQCKAGNPLSYPENEAVSQLRLRRNLFGSARPVTAGNIVEFYFLILQVLLCNPVREGAVADLFRREGEPLRLPQKLGFQRK